MRQRRGTWTQRVLIPSLVVIALAAGCGTDEESGKSEAGIPVRTAAVSYEEVSVPIHASGKLVAAAESKLSFKVGGIIGRVLVDEGAAVVEGQLLAELKMDEISAQVEQARSAFEKAERDLGRVTRLYADSVATLEQLQDAETGFSLAKSALEIAEFNEKHAVIRAPATGKVLKRFAEANELVGSGRPVFLFGSSGEGWVVRVGVSDRDLIRIQLGDAATVAFDAYPGELFTARVSEIGGSADPLSGTYEVELAVAAGAFKLVSGFVADVDILPTRCEAMYVVPIEAVMEADDDEAYVYVPEASGTIARRVPVRIGCFAGDEIAVMSGLEGVSEVVTDGAAYLSDGTSIRIVESE